jgi:hypothetical protein
LLLESSDGVRLIFSTPAKAEGIWLWHLDTHARECQFFGVCNGSLPESLPPFASLHHVSEAGGCDARLNHDSLFLCV